MLFLIDFVSPLVFKIFKFKPIYIVYQFFVHICENSVEEAHVTERALSYFATGE